MSSPDVFAMHQKAESATRPDAGSGTWLQLACHPATVRRALLTAVVVGSILVAINYGDQILEGRMTLSATLRALLTVAVPYAVSTISSVATRRELAP